MLTKVCLPSSLAIPLMTGSVLVGAASQPAQPTTWSGWSFLKALSSSTIFFCHAGSLTDLGAVKVATMWLVRSRP